MIRHRHRPNSLRSEKGQAMLEFALVAPILFTLVLGIVGFGIGLNYWIDLTHTANQGARYAAVNLAPVCKEDDPTPCGSDTFNEFLRKELTSGALRDGGTQSLPSAAIVTTCFQDENTPSGADAGEPVTVQIATKYRFVPFINLTVTLRGKATMRLEQQPSRLIGQSGGLPTSC